jgi:hypothetical protein
MSNVIWEAKIPREFTGKGASEFEKEARKFIPEMMRKIFRVLLACQLLFAFSRQKKRSREASEKPTGLVPIVGGSSGSRFFRS